MPQFKSFQEDFTPSNVVDDYYKSKMFSLDQGEVEIVIDLLKERGIIDENRKLGTLVDVGCGCGIATSLMAKYFDRAIGVDASPNQIQKALELNHPGHIEFKAAKAQSLPVESNSVEVVTAIFSVHFMNHELFVKECRRVLKPGGVAVFYSDLLSRLVSLDNDKHPVIVDEMTEMNKTSLEIAKASSHPERFDLDGFQTLFDSIDWPKKTRRTSEFETDTTIAAVRDYYLSCPFYRRLGSENPMLKSFQATKKVWDMEDKDDEDVHIRASFAASVIILTM